MMALESKSIDWTQTNLKIEDGTNTATFTPANSTNNIVDVMDEFAAWAYALFIPTFSWTWARDAATGGVIITLSATAVFTIEALDAATQAAYGLNPGATGYVTSRTFDAPAIGTWAPVSAVAVRANIRILARGDACANGAIRPGVPGLAAFRPAISAVGTATDAGRLAAVLGDAANPRRCKIYQRHTGLWLDLALGEVTRSPAGAKHYRFGITASGDAI